MFYTWINCTLGRFLTICSLQFDKIKIYIRFYRYITCRVWYYFSILKLTHILSQEIIWLYKTYHCNLQTFLLLMFQFVSIHIVNSLRKDNMQPMTANFYLTVIFYLMLCFLFAWKHHVKLQFVLLTADNGPIARTLWFNDTWVKHAWCICFSELVVLSCGIMCIHKNQLLVVVRVVKFICHIKCLLVALEAVKSYETMKLLVFKFKSPPTQV